MMDFSLAFTYRPWYPAHPFVENLFPLPLIQEKQVVSYWQKNGHQILVNCLWEARPGTVCQVTDGPDMNSGVYHGRKVTKQSLGRVS